MFDHKDSHDDGSRDTSHVTGSEEVAELDGEIQVADEEPKKSSLSVVGIGASAGGLEAMTALLQHVLPDSMAYVVVQHLAPQHESIMAEILSRSTAMTVRTAVDGMKIEPNCIYVIPPNAEMTMVDGHLHVVKALSGRGPRYEIDAFFRSLAEQAGPRAIGVVLSGTGTDGTLGIQAIKAAGGITFAQNPTTARYPDMPLHAIESGFADFTLSPVEIAIELTEIKDHPYLHGTSVVLPSTGDVYGDLLREMRRSFGTDLSYYKRTTLSRRIERRMALNRIESLEQYLEYSRKHPKELRLLFQDILIGVTGFFRDVTPFNLLRERVIPEIIKGKKVGDPLRIWVPACASGEEAYSIAISLVESLGDRLTDYHVQLFGTDIDNDAIQTARNGAYPPSIAGDVSPERLARFFIQSEDGYRVRRLLRDMLVFSTQNVTRDAPFSRMDLISCRNLLIYLQPHAQARVLRTLHYALNPDGVLLLGSSETLGEAGNLFVRLDRAGKFYQKKRVATPLPAIGPEADPGDAFTSTGPSGTRQHALLVRAVDRQVTDLYGPPGVLVNENLEVIQFRGKVTPYLEPAPGAATLNVLKLIHPKLQPTARTLIDQVGREQAAASMTVSFTVAGETKSLRLEALPIAAPEIGARCVLLLFFEAPQISSPLGRQEAAPAQAPADWQEMLEQELSRTQEYLQTTIEELETSNEELQSSNEELQSANEELQSINEEMETSREELQSSNEELTTTNDELQSRMLELGQVNDDLHNVLAGLETIVIIVERNARIRLMTASAQRTFHLAPEDVGQSIERLHGHLGNQRLPETITAVMEKVSPVERDVLAVDGTRYRMRIIPYQSRDHVIQGAVLMLVEADSGAERGAAVRQAVQEYAERSLRDSTHPIAVVDQNTRVLWVNNHFLRTFQSLPEEIIGERLARIGTGQWSGGPLLDSLRGVFASDRPFRDVRVTHVFPNIGPRTFIVSGAPHHVSNQERVVILTFHIEPAQASS